MLKVSPVCRNEFNSDYRDISVVIPQYGCWGETVACCSALWRHHGNELAITIVDDGSQQRNRKAAKRFLQSKVNWLEQEHKGITSAWNLGIQSCDAKYIVLLNNDVVTKKNWVNELVAQLKSEPRKLVGAEIRCEQLLSQLQDPLLRDDKKLLAGWCFGFDRDTFEKVGQFDEEMKLYWSDTDWQLRWKKLFGQQSKSLGLLSAGCVKHVGHVSTSRLKTRTEKWRKDRAVFLAKWL